MNHRLPIVLIVALAFLLISSSTMIVQAQTYTQYRIQLNSDGSAVWTITQVLGINGTTDTWAGFQEKINTLVTAAETQTHRPMSIDATSLQMTTNITSTSSKTAQYMFTWLNFSKTANEQITIGDVFTVPGFFNLLYGDGGLQVNYPQNYMLKSVAPTPDQREDSTQTLQWLGTQYFITEKPIIVLDAQVKTNDIFQPQTYLIVGAVSAVIAVVATSSFYIVYRRKKKNNAEPRTFPTMTPVVETEEEKVLRVLRLNGGSTYQSTVTEQCGFSKAKTSQLLTALEAKGTVRRYKKGRDKIVNLVEQKKVG